jgi:hypothetical protein
MAASTIFTCICGVEKKTTNHWILARVSSNSIQFLPWDRSLALSDDIIVLCGEGCAASLLSRSLGEWKQLPAEIATMERSSIAHTTH